MSYPPRNAELNQERLALSFTHAELTGTTTVKLWKAPAGRAFRIDRILYINDTGLVADATNAFRGEVKNGATLVAELFNTDSDDDPAGASLAAATFIELDSDVEVPSRVLAAGDTLSLVFTEDAAATLPTGRLTVEGRLL
jgi:hypothetical protein